VTTNQKLAENPAQVKRWIRAMTRALLFVRDRPEDAADIALRRLRIRNITKPMLIEAIRSYVRAFPPGVPGMPSPEGVKSILEHELRIPLKLDKPLAAEMFFDLRWVEEVRKEFTAKGVNP
jgi:ABC-type nitrate/sulfonate/bicarbonate transport system substrate-binding protein